MDRSPQIATEVVGENEDSEFNPQGIKEQGAIKKLEDKSRFLA